MRRHLHIIALVILSVVLLADLVLWGAVADLPDVGELIRRSANSEAILASVYMSAGSYLDNAIPGLKSIGTSVMSEGLSPAFARILEEPNVAMDLILSSGFNRTHGWIKTLYWAAPVMLVVFLLLWLIKPKKVKLIGKR